MSIKTIKNTLENHLNSLYTTQAIKWFETTAYTLNSVPLTAAQIDALTLFVEPRIVPITQDTEILSTSDSIKYEVFFQIDIYSKTGTGSGSVYTAIEVLDAIFVKQIISGVTVGDSKTLPSFNEGENLITPVRYLAWIYG